MGRVEGITAGTSSPGHPELVDQDGGTCLEDRLERPRRAVGEPVVRHGRVGTESDRRETGDVVPDSRGGDVLGGGECPTAVGVLGQERDHRAAVTGVLHGAPVEAWSVARYDAGLLSDQHGAGAASPGGSEGIGSGCSRGFGSNVDGWGSELGRRGRVRRGDADDTAHNHPGHGERGEDRSIHHMVSLIADRVSARIGREFCRLTNSTLRLVRTSRQAGSSLVANVAGQQGATRTGTRAPCQPLGELPSARRGLAEGGLVRGSRGRGRPARRAPSPSVDGPWRHNARRTPGVGLDRTRPTPSVSEKCSVRGRRTTRGPPLRDAAPRPHPRGHEGTRLVLQRPGARFRPCPHPRAVAAVGLRGGATQVPGSVIVVGHLGGPRGRHHHRRPRRRAQRRAGRPDSRHGSGTSAPRIDRAVVGAHARGHPDPGPRGRRRDPARRGPRCHSVRGPAED